MANQYGIMTLDDYCLGCGICELVCEMEHNLTAGSGWIKVNIPSPENGGEWQTRRVVIHCMHCTRPVCAEACPQGAITKRDDGIVLIDETLCNGCKVCIEACPIDGAIQFSEDEAIARKCDLCYHRLDNGLLPACAAACPSHCIYVGEMDEICEMVHERRILTWYADNMLGDN
jgi:Fe-S-cluster-containing dehydrogenase component